MMVGLVICMGALVYGGLYILFAFREPPAMLARSFPARVPLLFGLVLCMLPDRIAMRVDRLGLGGLFLFLSGMIFFNVVLR